MFQISPSIPGSNVGAAGCAWVGARVKMVKSTRMTTASQRERSRRGPFITTEKIKSYLEAVLDDGFAGCQDRPVGAVHSDRHRVLLAHFRLRSGDATEHDRDALRDAAVLDAQRTIRLRQITDQFACKNIRCLILKGAAFSALAYPAPHLRPRNDDDVWVRQTDFAVACDVLAAAGYEAQVEVTSSEITRQRHFVARGHFLAHEVDLHWWPVNPSAFDALPSFDECFARSESLDAIGRNARAPGPVHALLLACAHRVAHHTETEDAMWHCDLYFLAQRLAAAEWAEFESLARRAKIARVSGVALQYVVTRLGTDVPHDVIDRLTRVDGEPSSRYLRPLGPLRDFWLELTARRSVLARLRFVAHHLLPPRHYVAARYRYNGVVLLPLFYAHRAISGFAHWTAEFVARLAR